MAGKIGLVTFHVVAQEFDLVPGVSSMARSHVKSVSFKLYFNTNFFPSYPFVGHFFFFCGGIAASGERHHFVERPSTLCAFHRKYGGSSFTQG